jgi:hypothetical protein
MMRVSQDPSPRCTRPVGLIELIGECNVRARDFTCDKITEEVDCWDDVDKVRFWAALELRNGEPISICDETALR